MRDAGRRARRAGPARWLLGQPRAWLDDIRWAVLDPSGPYRAAFDTAIPDARQVADPFHVVWFANTALTAANLLFEMLCVLPGVQYAD